MARRASIAKEVWLFIREKGRWWAAPVFLLVLVLLLFVLLSASGALPFMYTLF